MSAVQHLYRPRASVVSRVAAGCLAAITLFALLVAIVGSGRTVVSAQSPATDFALTALSTRPHMVSGGNVLVRLRLGAGGRSQDASVVLNGRDVTGAFTADPNGESLTGLVEGLVVGENRLTASAGRASAALNLTNYPLTGPIFSGPHSTPFVCETEAAGLGAALDVSCSAATRVTYFYKSTAPLANRGPGVAGGGSPFTPLADPASRPEDLATFTLKNGERVPYIVRVESGTINRGIYRIAMLDNPSATQGEPWKPGPAWNGKLQYRFGGGCGFGRHQGNNRETDVLDDTPLSRGYAVATSTLNVYGTACDDVVSAETAMMVKEHFIERYGVPRYVVGWGGSGGAMQQYLIADNYPGILDALMPSSAFPDGQTLTHTPTDCALLNHYFFDGQATAPWTEAEQLAVSGFGVRASCLDKNVNWGAFANGSTNSVYPTHCGSVIPAALAYDPVKNPTGVRCTIYDSLITYLGKDPRTGFVRRPLDNVGIQYGLKALTEGVISPEQFLDLNSKIGGFDVDGNFVAQRTTADPEGAANGYKTGRIFHGKGTSLPIMDLRTYQDHLEGRGNVHTRFHTFEARQRLTDANGTAANQIIWTWAPTAPVAEYNGQALDRMDEWMENLLRDTSNTPYATKVTRAKPATLVDGCWDLSGVRIDEPASVSPTSRCNALFPIYANARLAAGSPIQENVEKCVLKPMTPADYRGFTPQQVARLREIFPGGVCDYSKPGVGQQPPAGTWQSYGPAPQSRTTETSSTAAGTVTTASASP